MALVKFNNGRSYTPAFTPFNDLFDTLFNDKAFSKLPAVNIAETDNQYEVELAVPGLKKEDFKINLEESVLTISAENKKEAVEEGKKVTRKEFSYSSFSRSFTLPEIADSDNIQASYTDGVLSITIAKKKEEKAQAKQIQIS